MLGVHIYYMQFYKTVVNQVVLVFLFSLLFACMDGVLISTFMILFSGFSNFISPFAGFILVTGFIVSIPIGVMLPRLRVSVMGFMIHDPSPLQRMLYQLQENEVLVPRGDFEVEMAARIIRWVSGVSLLDPGTSISDFFQPKGRDSAVMGSRVVCRSPNVHDGPIAESVPSLPVSHSNERDLESNQQHRIKHGSQIHFTPEFQQLLDELLISEEVQQDTKVDLFQQQPQHEEMENNQQQQQEEESAAEAGTEPGSGRRSRNGYRDAVLDKVDEMFRTALEIVHARSVFVHISYATFCAHCLGLGERAIGIISIAERELNSFALDMRMILYIRKKTWMDTFIRSRPRSPETDRTEQTEQHSGNGGHDNDGADEQLQGNSQDLDPGEAEEGEGQLPLSRSPQS